MAMKQTAPADAPEAGATHDAAAQYDRAAAHIAELAARARAAARTGGRLTRAEKDRALFAIADVLGERAEDVLSANARDLEAASGRGEASARIDRLTLTRERLADMAEGLRQVAALPDPVGEVIAAFTRPNGLSIEQVRVPFGVIGMVYEARPNVTVDAAALTLKTGNAAILRGGREAFCSNAALTAALREGLERAGLPADLAQMVQDTDRRSVDALIRARGLVDLVIPRGGAGLIEHVVRHAVVPVIETGLGNCHVYVDRAADIGMAVAVTVNSKARRPSVCNAAETLLVHADIAGAFLPAAARALAQHGVELRLDEAALAIVARSVPEARVKIATEADFAEEFLDRILAVRLVGSLAEALGHIARYGTQHSEAIVTADEAAAAEFLRSVDAAAVYHNAPTSFTDGFEFGFGAEIGISTQKLHARGPMGLRELTSYKYAVRGNGQLRP